MKLSKYSQIVLAFVLIASYGVSVVSAQDYFDLNYGTDAMYTQFNYSTTSTDSCCGPVYPTYPFPASWQATTDGSTAYTSIQAPHDYGGKVYANKGVQLTPQFGTYTWDQVKDWPIMITFDYYYDIQADPFHGSANAGITIPWLVDGISPTNKPIPGVNCVVWSGNEIGNSGLQSGRNIQEFMKTSDGRLLTVDVLKEMSNTLQIAVQSQAASDPDESGLPSAYSRVIINNIKVNFDPLWNSPVASFTYSPTIVHEGENVHFDAYSSLPLNGIIKYTWEFKDETKVTTEPLTDHSFQDSGEHDVTLTVELKNGKTATFTETIDVKNQPPVAAFTVKPRIILPEQPIILDASNSFDPENGPLTFDWYYDEDTLPQLNHNKIFKTTFYQCDPINVKLVVTDENGLLDSTSKTITPYCSKVKIDVKAHQAVPVIGWHNFIVYTDPKGKETYYRGGPEVFPPMLPPMGFGMIVTESGPFVNGSIDWQQPLFSTTVLKGADAYGKDKCFASEMIRIQNKRLTYKPLGPNSNTVARSALHNCDCPETSPVARFFVPGWNSPYI